MAQQPNMQALANGVQVVTQELLLLPNLPLVQQGQQLQQVLQTLTQQGQTLTQQGQTLQQVQQTLQQVQQTLAQHGQTLQQVQQTLQQVQQTQLQMQQQLIAGQQTVCRLHNRTRLDADPLMPLPAANGAVPAGFPATKAALFTLQAAQVTPLLHTYGLPINGNISAKRIRLNAFVSG